MAEPRPGPTRDLLLLGPAHEVADHEEVAGEAHLRDDPQLELDAVLVLRLEAVGEAVRGVLLDLGAQEVVLGLAGGKREPRHPVDLAEHPVVGLDALGDQQGVVGGAGHLGIPVLAHFRGAAQVITITVELEAVGVVERLPRLDAQQRGVRFRLVFRDVMGIVRGQRWQIELLGDLEQSLPHAAFDREAVVHQFEEEVLLPEDVAVIGGRGQCLLDLAEAQAGLHLAGRAAGGGDDPVGMRVDELAIHARLAVVAVEGGQAGELEQIAEAGGGARQHRHVRVGARARDVAALAVLVGAALARLPPEHRLLVVARLRREIGFNADDGLGRRFPGAPVEFRGTVHVAVVGHRHCGHLEALDLVEQCADLGRAVEHRILGVHM